MEAIEKINIRGTIRSMEAVGEKFVFPRTDDYKPSAIRNIASSVKGDTGMAFRVKVTPDRIIVERTK